jgi:hypothetical protein
LPLSPGFGSEVPGCAGVPVAEGGVVVVVVSVVWVSVCVWTVEASEPVTPPVVPTDCDGVGTVELDEPALRIVESYMVRSIGTSSPLLR